MDAADTAPPTLNVDEGGLLLTSAVDVVYLIEQ
jgi:hypothetical protein